MLNSLDVSRLLMLPIGVLSGLFSARDMKAGLLAIILFTFAGLLLGIGSGWLSFKIERQFLVRGKNHIVGLLLPFAGLAAAYIAPVLLALIIYGHK